eukprot:1366459-Amphidinium_carterae.1
MARGWGSRRFKQESEQRLPQNFGIIFRHRVRTPQCPQAHTPLALASTDVEMFLDPPCQQ